MLPQKKSTLKTQKQTEEMQALPMKNEINSVLLRQQDLPIHSVISTRIRQKPIPGGHIVSVQGQRMQGGV